MCETDNYGEAMYWAARVNRDVVTLYIEEQRISTELQVMHLKGGDMDILELCSNAEHRCY